MGRMLFRKAEASLMPWFGKGGDDWESAQKEHGCLGRDRSTCSLDGGNIGRLERLGECKCGAQLTVLGMKFWPEKDEKRSLT
jgi:hypothetical protein